MHPEDPFQRIREALDEIEVKFKCPPKPQPEPEPERPPAEPRDWPAASPIALPSDGDRLAAWYPTPWTEEGDFRWCRRAVSEGELLYIVIWEQMLDGRAWETVLACNSLPGRGIVRPPAVAPSSNRKELIGKWGSDPLWPMEARVFTTRMPVASDWSGMGPDDGPLAGACAAAQASVGWPSPNSQWWPDGRHDAPAGFGVGWYAGGREDWARHAEGRAMRCGQMLAEARRAFWRHESGTHQPALAAPPYWSGRDYNVNQVAWYEWASAHPQHSTTVAHDGPHFRRQYGAAAAIAPWSILAREVCRMAWADVQSAWNLDAPYHANSLLRGFGAHRDNPPRWPAPTGLHGSRYFAHAVMCLVDCAPWIDDETVQRYAEAFAEWYLALADLHGTTNRDRSGDAESIADAAGIAGNPTSAFQQSLVTGAMWRLVESGFVYNQMGERVVQKLRASARFWMPQIAGRWPYLIQADTRALLAADYWTTLAHTGTSPDAGTYYPMVCRRWGGAFPDRATLMARAAATHPTGDQPLDLVPPELWRPEGRR
jgi:hypothetical protein